MGGYPIYWVLRLGERGLRASEGENFLSSKFDCRYLGGRTNRTMGGVRAYGSEYCKAVCSSEEEKGVLYGSSEERENVTGAFFSDSCFVSNCASKVDRHYFKGYRVDRWLGVSHL